MSEWNTAYEALLDTNEDESDGKTSIELKNMEEKDQSKESGIYSFSPATMTQEERYQHAAIYLEEGERHFKFKYHPIGKETLKAYKAVHGPLVNLIDLMAGLLLLALALFEKPPVIQLPVWVTADIEIILLFCLLIHSLFYYRWKGKRVLKEKKMILKHFLIFEMFIEALVVLIRESHHIRFMRAFRPVFLLTNRYTTGMKRVLREILESLPPVLDVLILLFFFVTTLSVVGFHWFSEGCKNDNYTHDRKNWYFEDFGDSWVNLFILTTTANYPDVMMPAYKKYSCAPIFFIFFLLFGLYFIGNLILAAIYNNFSKKENEKFGRLYYHQRRGFRLAFEMVDQDGKKKMNFETFKGIMTAYNSWKARDVLIAVFCALDKDKKGYLTLNDWFNLQRVLPCSWKQDTGQATGLFCGTNKYPCQMKRFFKMLRRMIDSKWFEYFIDVAIVVNAGLIITTVAEKTCNERNGKLEDGRLSKVGYTTFFLALYIAEAVLKITSLGFKQYIINAYNRFDFVVVVVSLVAYIISHLPFETGDFGQLLLILRPFRLLRLLRVRQSFLNILASIVNLVPKMQRFLMTLLCVYFFFAIIGMESFHHTVSKCGCVSRIWNESRHVQCRDELFVGPDGLAYTYVFNENNIDVCDPEVKNQICIPLNCSEALNCTVLKCGRYYGNYYDRSSADGLYHLNNFDNLLRSYVTLFELMVVNNWHVTMQGTVDAVRYFTTNVPAELSRAYFIVFYIVMVIIVTNIVVAFILDAFQSILPLMKKRHLANIDEEDPLVTEIHIQKKQFNLMMEGQKPRKIVVQGPDDTGTFRLLGRRPITNLDIQEILFADNIQSFNDRESKDAGLRDRDPQTWAHTPGIITGTPPASVDDTLKDTESREHDSDLVDEATNSDHLD